MLLLLFQNNLTAPSSDVLAKHGGDDAFRRGRFQVQVKEKLHSFDSDYEAQEFIQRLQEKAKQTIAAKNGKIKVKPVIEILKVVEIKKPETPVFATQANLTRYDEDDDICCILLLA